MGDAKRIAAAADIVAAERARGHQIAVTVSAMAPPGVPKETDRLLGLAREAAGEELTDDMRAEFDVAVSPAKPCPPPFWLWSCKSAASRREAGRAGNCR